MSVRITIKIFLTLQLLLLIFRQMIDFAGIQWLMILVNALAIIITITGFFGYLLLYASFQVFLIVYNIYVICVYARFITFGNISETSNDVSATTTATNLFKTSEHFFDDVYPIDPVVRTSPLLPSAQLLSFDSNSRSFWYVIVSNHISNIQAHLNHYNRHHNQPPFPQSSAIINKQSIVSNTNNNDNNNNIEHHGLRHPLDESLVDLCVQYIEIAIACLHIFVSLLAIGLILLKYKLERDKFFRNNDKTTPPLPPYTISPHMNHYMSFTPTISTATKSSVYNQNNGSVCRSSKRRRSTRSLHTQKSKSHSLGALNNIRTNSSGSLRSISKQSHHRKSATSLLMMNNHDTSFGNNTIGSRSGAKNSHSNNYPSTTAINNNSLYGTIISTPINKPSIPLRQQHRNHQTYQQRHSVYTTNGGSSAAQHVAKFLNSDSETDYYHTFTPAYLNNGLANPLYGKRNSYLDSSETAI